MMGLWWTCQENPFFSVEGGSASTAAPTILFWGLQVGFDSKDKSFAARRFKERQQAVQKAKKRQLLWHGSALSSIACILTNGSLRKVQRAAHGRMFGDGVYFADCMCKSLTYCSGGAENEVYLLLCSVDLDQEYPTNQYFEDVDPEVWACPALEPKCPGHRTPRPLTAADEY